jgi:hypothetical protein
VYKSRKIQNLDLACSPLLNQEYKMANLACSHVFRLFVFDISVFLLMSFLVTWGFGLAAILESDAKIGRFWL